MMTVHFLQETNVKDSGMFKEDFKVLEYNISICHEFFLIFIVMVFHCNNTSFSCLGAVNDQFHIQRFNGKWIYHSDIDFLCVKEYYIEMLVCFSTVRDVCV